MIVSPSAAASPSDGVPVAISTAPHLRKVFRVASAAEGYIRSADPRSRAALFFRLLIHSRDAFMADIETSSRHLAHLPLRSLAHSLLLAILVACGLYAVFIAGPAMRAAAHESLERTIADEDRQFCESFGIRAGTDAFAACSRALSSVRQKQVDRDKAAAQGIL